MRFRQRAFTMAIGLGLSGVVVAGAAAKPPTAVADSATLELKLQVDVTAKASGSSHAASVGEVFSEGDLLALRVELTRSAYVYVAQLQPDSAPEVLFPAGELGAAKPLAAAAQTRIPSVGAFELDAAHSEGRLFVAASAQPLSAPKVRELALKASAALTVPRDAPPPPPPSRPPPEPIRTTERQIKRDEKPAVAEPAKVLRAAAPGSSVASIVFNYRIRAVAKTPGGKATATK